ncbi:hypothetical protein G647_07796 [Cladophialophora carrionii CBS 160.54]|uniref:C2H2-type domain-containing protein n=1 Tax=Cladophialophora carrionii CBS 160.54 TaxID=1279043 RepID=V9D3I0_9EURO|nr:uncharacterized protein G647_07796 [Cladophialophora carrionii CBS 160.54]ETI21449.1 hypothetical protein G647_07796 [Cladophialophora carrionii CBS 160.54]
MDMAFCHAAEAFMATHEPSTQTAHLRADLQWFVAAFYMTSQGLLVQQQLLILHNYYNLDGLLEDGILDSTRMNVTAHLQSLAPATHPSSNLSVLLLLAQALSLPLQYTQTQSPPAGNVPYNNEMSGNVNVSSEPAEPGTEVTEGACTDKPPSCQVKDSDAVPSGLPLRTTSLNKAGNVHVLNLPPLPKHHHPHNPERCHPPNLERGFSIDHRDKDWMYKCDECGHAVRYRDEFQRHFDRQPGFATDFRS